MPLKLPFSAWVALRREGNNAIQKEWLAAGLHKGGGEVACIKNLIQKGIPKLEAAWQSILGNHNLQVGIAGAVCHPIPQVIYKGAINGCELGDLLIVHDHFPHNGEQERRACIMQAKLFGSSGVTVKNDIQKTLYQTWPEFAYTKWPGGLSRLEEMLSRHAGISKGTPGALKRRLNSTIPYGRVASPDEVDQGCRYAMIDTIRVSWNFPFQSSPWRICSANVRHLYKHRRGPTLPGYLIRILSGDAGRNVPQLSWPKNLGSACHWSLMISELMQGLPLHGSSLKPAGDAASLIVGGPEKSGPGTDVEEPERAFGVISVITAGGPLPPDRYDPSKDH